MSSSLKVLQKNLAFLHPKACFCSVKGPEGGGLVFLQEALAII